MDWVTFAAGIGTIIDRYGLPLVLLGLLVFAVWRITPWVKDLVEKVVARIIKYFDQQAKAFSQMAEALLLLRASFDMFSSQFSQFKTETTQRLDHIEELIEAKKERGGR